MANITLDKFYEEFQKRESLHDARFEFIKEQFHSIRKDFTHDLNNTQEQIKTVHFDLTNQIKETRKELITKISDTREELITKISDTREELITKISDTREELGAEISKLRVEFKTEAKFVREELKIIKDQTAYVTERLVQVENKVFSKNN